MGYKNIIKKGFLLIELIIYLAITSIFILLVFSLVNQIQKQLIFITENIENDVKNSNSLDLLKRDLICANHAIKNWDIKNFVFKKIVFDKNKKIFLKKAICWFVCKQGLTRLEGDYDFNKKRWNKKITSRVNFFKIPLKFQIQKSTCGRFVKYVKINYATFESIIYLRNVKLA